MLVANLTWSGGIFLKIGYSFYPVLLLHVLAIRNLFTEFFNVPNEQLLSFV